MLVKMKKLLYVKKDSKTEPYMSISIRLTRKTQRNTERRCELCTQKYAKPVAKSLPQTSRG